MKFGVAPVRERGLKCISVNQLVSVFWFFFVVCLGCLCVVGCGWVVCFFVVFAGVDRVVGRSREGAWIEIAPSMSDNGVGSGRSREGAWIEIMVIFDYLLYLHVAPVRERGLK